jgi:hypothetical protein
MSNICTECPVWELLRQNTNEYHEGMQCGVFDSTVRAMYEGMLAIGSVGGLEPGPDLTRWGDSADASSNAAYLLRHPNLALAVEACAKRIKARLCQ